MVASSMIVMSQAYLQAPLLTEKETSFHEAKEIFMNEKK